MVKRFRLIKNDRKRGLTHPDYVGIYIDCGIEYRVAAWIQADNSLIVTMNECVIRIKNDIP